jgi:hypothetical protein
MEVMSDRTTPLSDRVVLKWGRKLPASLNLAVTAAELFVAYWTMVVRDYDGFCHGFSDGKSPCSFAEHVSDSNGWFMALSFITVPLTLITGAVLWAANGALYRVASRASRL